MEKITWKAPEYIYTEKTSDWYWIVGIITVSIATIAIILNNIIFAVLILVGIFTLTLYASRRPSVITIELNNSGIKAGPVYYPYGDLESFWVEEKDKFPRIIIKSKKALSPYIIILIENTSTEEIRSYLVNYLEEETHTESLLNKILIYFGF